MRINSGNLGGRVIHAPKNLPVRPTTDLAKESLFNILNNQIDFENCRVLDLFSGTGNISYEFVSRGSIQVTAIEHNFRCVKFIKEIGSKFDMKELKVIQANVFSFLKYAEPHDIIFADPPYDFGRYDELVELIINRNILNLGGLLIIEHPKEIELHEHQGYRETRNYGRVNFSFFESANI